MISRASPETDIKTKSNQAGNIPSLLFLHFLLVFKERYNFGFQYDYRARMDGTRRMESGRNIYNNDETKPSHTAVSPTRCGGMAYSKRCSKNSVILTVNNSVIYDLKITINGVLQYVGH